MNEKAIPVMVCAADNRYAMPLAVMLRSMADHLVSYPRVSVWVLDGGISWLRKRRVVASLPQGKVELQWVRPSHRRLKGVPVFGHVSICTYYRLLIGELLPNSITKVIYLDVDTLVQGDIGELWDVEMKSTTLAAVPHSDMNVSAPYGLAMYKELGLSPDTPYFNAGVLLIDLVRWRTLDMQRLASKFVEQYGTLLNFWDQDVLNGVLAGSWGVLSAKWNVCVGHLWKGNVTGLVSNPGETAIIHFASAIKPWDYGSQHPFQDVYFGWIDRTVWRGWRPKRQVVNWKRIRKNVGNRHWYGAWIRRVPGIGLLWGAVMVLVKSRKASPPNL